MSEMIERVARRLHSADMVWNEVDWERLREPQVSAFTRSARAAIQAMREPTEAMERVALIPDPDGSGLWSNVSFIWERMIDAALDEKEGGQ